MKVKDIKTGNDGVPPTGPRSARPRVEPCGGRQALKGGAFSVEFSMQQGVGLI